MGGRAKCVASAFFKARKFRGINKISTATARKAGANVILVSRAFQKHPHFLELMLT
jgi:hypothetical protein